MKDVFPHYRGEGKTLDDFETRDNPYLERALDVTREYIADLKAMRGRGMGLTYTGQNGVGKTHLACAVMSAAKEAKYRIECIELDNYIKLHLEMFRVNTRLAKAGYDEDSMRSFELDERLRYIEFDAKFLLIDDLGREHASQSGWSSEQVFGLIKSRYNRHLPTVITTNLPFPELDARYTEGLSSFLKEATITVDMEGEDYRHASWSARD